MESRGTETNKSEVGAHRRSKDGQLKDGKETWKPSYGLGEFKKTL